MGASHSSDKAAGLVHRSTNRKSLRASVSSSLSYSSPKKRLLSTLSGMGYDSLPLEIELKILEEIEWTETVACSQVCTRWRDHLARAKAHDQRYLPDRQSIVDSPKRNSSGVCGLRAKRNSGDAPQLQNLSTSFSELTVTIATDEAPPTGFADDANTGAIPQSAILGRGSVVLLHRFMHEADHSFGFFVKVDPAAGSHASQSINPPEGFFLIGNERLHSHANSLGGRAGSLVLASETTPDHASTSESSTIDSSSDDIDTSFAGTGSIALQLSRQWQWSEPLFNSPMCDTEILYGRGFETFKRLRRNIPYNPRAGSGNGTGRYLRRLSELDLADGKTCVTVRQLVAAISRSVRTIKMLEPEARERGGVFFVKFDGIRMKEYMKYVPHGFFDFETGGRIELEIYEGVQWVPS
ncbi:hypothetical protein TWF696_000430 [Orbilia brochopaga]|uniref:F-box domain-containing protein n=1 Tax=Orbilia brochopaga TaxID=3140254 RepID=A0AAV9VCT8_9PEZI